jgi:hypothetical protein
MWSNSHGCFAYSFFRHFVLKDTLALAIPSARILEDMLSLPSGIIAFTLSTCLALAKLPVQELVGTNNAVVPVQQLKGSIIHPNFTTSHSEHILDASVAPDFFATLVLCPSANCNTLQSCDLQDLHLIPNQCFTIPPPTINFNSTFISQLGTPGLNFTVAVGTANCTELVALPSVNTCFNSDIALTTFAVLVPGMTPVS